MYDNKNNKFEVIMIQKLKCNYCQTVFEDLINKSGAMTKHLRIKHNIIANKISVFSHYHIIEQQQKELYVCPICNEWTTPDIKNLSGIITVHNKKTHNLQIEDFVNLYPQYKQVFKTYYNKKEYKQQTINNKQQLGIQCQICGEWRRTINHRHLKLHNISISEYKQKFAQQVLTSKVSHQKRSKQTIIINGLMKQKFGGTMPINRSQVYVQRKQMSYDKLKNYLITQKDIELLSPFQNYKKGNNVEYKCNICGDTHVKKYDAADTTIRCYTCFPKVSFSSKEEQLIYNYIIQQLNVSADRCRRDILPRQLQLDIYCPQYNIAIQVNGLYYHSQRSNNRDKNYHLNKTLQCNNLGITLIHIFDDQIRDKLQIVKSRLSHLFNKDTNIFQARKCIIKEVDNKLKSQFLELNHIQGNTQSAINIGAYYNDQLVSIITFGRPRFKSKYQFQLIRMCNKLYTSIPGIFNRIFKYFIQNYKPNSIISYCDIRWSNNKQKYIYDNLGFKHSHNSKPNYFYTKDYVYRQNRFKYRKSELLKMFNSNDINGLTEQQIMYNVGYDRIWDCGSMVFIYI